MVAIVGTRNATPYGLRTARRIATALAEAGVTIVSGLAVGIDAAAHRAAIECGGNTIAVLGTGVDVPYPAGHRGLHQLMAEKGLVISEREPGTRAEKGAFPKRNRIIAGLSKCVIVVEAGFKSGAKNTFDHAGRFGVPVGAVPGMIDSPQSDGTNLMLRDHAVMITSVDDALMLAGVSAPLQRPPLTLEGNDALVWSAIGAETMDVDRIASSTGLTARECLATVTSLELGGMVECLVTGEVRRR
jgi:DNA processing protein